jgi:hypothetical protein
MGGNFFGKRPAFWLLGEELHCSRNRGLTMMLPGKNVCAIANLQKSKSPSAAEQLFLYFLELDNTCETRLLLGTSPSGALTPIQPEWSSYTKSSKRLALLGWRCPRNLTSRQQTWHRERFKNTKVSVILRKELHPSASTPNGPWQNRSANGA